MAIDNFKTIETHLLDFVPGSYYKFEALVRNTDGINPLWVEGMSNTNRNIMIKTWLVEDWDYYQRVKHEAKILCQETGARLYVVLDRMNIKKSVINAYKRAEMILMNSYLEGNQDVSLIRFNGIVAAASSSKESSDKETRMWMFDIDCDSFDLVEQIQTIIYPRKMFTLATKKGFHIVTPKTGFKKLIKDEELFAQYPILEKYKDSWDIAETALGLVYVPDTQRTIHYHNCTECSFCVSIPALKKYACNHPKIRDLDLDNSLDSIDDEQLNKPYIPVPEWCPGGDR